MSFLDRFKPTPRWRHADAAVRVAAVAEIPDDEEYRPVLTELAGDDDIRVRRAASARIVDVEDLVRLVRTERDDDLRRELSERLVGIATAPADTDAAAARALEGLDDQKQLSTIAKSSPHDTVRAAALGRVHDAKSLSSIARHAADPQTALDAVARIADPAELLNVALKTEHKDAGIAALERTAQALAEGYARETLDGVATRAKNKPVSKRARAMVQAIDDAATARRQALEAWRHRIGGVLARIEAIGAAPTVPDARAQLLDTEATWRETSTQGAFELDPDTASRFDALLEAARAAIANHERALAEQREMAERADASRLARASLCERVENAHAEGAIEGIETARAEWDGLGPSPQEAEDDRLKGRFEEACRRAAARHDNRLEVQKINARLEELAADAERLAPREDAELKEEDEPVADAWTAVQREWESLQSKSEAIDPIVAGRYAEASRRVRQRADERRAAAERAIRQHVQRIEQLIERAIKRAADEDLTLREADRLTRELRMAVEAPLEVGEREQYVILERLKVAQAAIGPKLHELRELDEWKRFANAAVQEELIAKAQALHAKYGFDTPEGVKPDDLEKAARELHEIQERWTQAADAPRAQAQALWHRYRQAADPIQTKVREFFAQRTEERKGNLDGKQALIAQAEALADSTDWIKTADELKKLQADWQAIGPVPRQDTRVTWKRFREACDTFFTRRNADLAQRKEVWSTNLARKDALCARAEELTSATDWEKAAAEIRRLQAEWKTVGPVRRNKSEAIWLRFRAACDAFFERYKRRDQIDLEGRQADREALVSELESLVAPDPSGAVGVSARDMAYVGTDDVEIVEIAPAQPAPLDNASLLEQVRSLRSRWNQSSPTVRQGADPLSARFMDALERLTVTYPDAFRGTELDVDANRQKMERLCTRVEGFLTEAAATPAGASHALAAMLREALASNTIGGRAGEENKWKAMAEDVRQAQAAWTRLGPVPGAAGRQLADRFHRACGRFFDLLRRKVPPEAPSQHMGRPVGVR